MRVLVTVASRHGSTWEIGEAIGRTLRDHGLEADVLRPEEVATLDGYRAVVAGSAVYLGRWLDSARQLVKKHADTLATLPVWLFSSGPVGAPLRPAEEPAEAAALMSATGAQSHRLFPGKLDRHTLGLAEKTVTIALRAPDGDFRDWPAVHDWAADIASTLCADPTAERPRAPSGTAPTMPKAE